jgi:hypothetical protein
LLVFSGFTQVFCENLSRDFPVSCHSLVFYTSFCENLGRDFPVSCNFLVHVAHGACGACGACPFLALLAEEVFFFSKG